LKNYQEGIGSLGPEGWAWNSKFQVLPLRSGAGNQRLWIMDPNISNQNRRPLGCVDTVFSEKQVKKG
jgi:hypothetical protein